jgi:hypothetical protein
MRNKLIGMMLLSASVYAQTTKPAVRFVFDSNLLVASGRWISSDPKVKAAYPSEVEIDCVRTTKICTEATAEYYSGLPHVSLAYLEIIKWDGSGIIATSADAICMIRTVILSFPDKSINETRSPKKLATDVKAACKTLGLTDSEMSIFVVMGSPKWEQDPYGESLHKF